MSARDQCLCVPDSAHPHTHAPSASSATARLPAAPAAPEVSASASSARSLGCSATIGFVQCSCSCHARARAARQRRSGAVAKRTSLSSRQALGSKGSRSISACAWPTCIEVSGALANTAADGGPPANDAAAAAADASDDPEPREDAAARGETARGVSSAEAINHKRKCNEQQRDHKIELMDNSMTQSASVGEPMKALVASEWRQPRSTNRLLRDPRRHMRANAQ